MNEVQLIGRLTKDPERIAAQSTMCRFTLAVDRRSKDGGADFIPCKVFGKTADFVLNYLQKGRKVAVIGRIQTGSYTNKDGATIYTTDVVANSVEFCDSKPAEGNAEPARTKTAVPRRTRPEDPLDGFLSIPEGIDEELPFS